MYKRVLLKLSGEALAGNNGFGIDEEVLFNYASEVKSLVKSGVEVCMVIGAGNLFRGTKNATRGMDRTVADSVGMLATVMNALTFSEALKSEGVDAVVMSAWSMPAVCEQFHKASALKYLKQGKVVIFSAGTGNPFCTTDSAGSLRAAEMECDALLKATQVDGVYSADPKKDKNAVRYDTITFEEVLSKGLKVMDAMAVAISLESNIPIIVFAINKKGILNEIVKGEGSFTIIKGKE
ncbi:MAG: Uridylate kinase [Alphaproteobacteria bacterium ADurb.Bin438]|nr:MAG: Uridylate kinase [Alphaproteobacteria bacterium ADurb.Bin438]